MKVCTISDFSYLEKGLALYESLKLTSQSEFTLYYLCIDERTFNILEKYKLSAINIVPINLKNLEDNDPDLRSCKDDPPRSNYGDKYSWYCWSLTPYFINYVLHNFVEENELLAYCDSDIFLFKPLELILNRLNDKSIGLHTHRYSGSFRSVDTGWFNTGIVIIKKDKIGIEASGNWKNWLLHSDNIYAKTYGTCGDQKYLELFLVLYKGQLCIFDEGNHILHAAPWCCNDIYTQQINFFHFSHFSMDEQGKWKDNIKGEWNPSSSIYIKRFYNIYAEIIRQKKSEIKAIS